MSKGNDVWSDFGTLLDSVYSPYHLLATIFKGHDPCFECYSYLSRWLGRCPNLLHTSLGWGPGLQELS